MTSRDLHQAIIDGNFTTGRRYIGRCSMVFRGKKACHVACGDTYTKRGTTTVQFLESLESNGADLEDPDEDGFTTLLLAALFHCDPGPVVAFLNSKVPAVVDKTDKTGRNALHLLDTETMLLAMDELLPNISLDAQDELGNTALHYHVTAKGAFAVEACLKLLQAGADFRLKNKNGQEPLELLESNDKLSTKQLDQVKCEIWARMDRTEQTQELQKSLEDVEAENSEQEPEPPKRRASIFDDLPKTILKDTVEIFNDEPLSKKLGDKEEYSGSEGEEEEEEEPLSDSCLDSEPELVDIDSEPEQLESSFESRKNENEESEEIVPEVFVSECASPVSEMAQTESVPSQLPAPVFLKEEQFSFSSSLKDSISGSFESIPLNSEDEESPSPEPSPKQMPKIYSQAYCCPSGVKKVKIDGPLASHEHLDEWLNSQTWQGQVISKFKQLSLCNPENWIGGNKSDVMKWVKSKDGRSLHLQDRQLIKSATSRWNKIYKISV